MMTFNKWFAGMVSAAISGGANAALAVAVAPDVFLTGGYEKIALLFAGGAAIGVLNYLKQSPLAETVK